MAKKVKHSRRMNSDVESKSSDSEGLSTVEDLAGYRIRRLAEQAEMMQRMIAPPDDVDGMDGLFPDYAALLTVSALIGYSTNSYMADFMSRKGGEPVQRQFFKPDQQKLIDLIAYARTKEPTIIRKVEKYNIFSAYAAAGFEILCSRLDANNRDWTRSADVLECGKLLAQWYLRGSSSFSSFADLH